MKTFIISMIISLAVVFSIRNVLAGSVSARTLCLRCTPSCTPTMEPTVSPTPVEDITSTPAPTEATIQPTETGVPWNPTPTVYYAPVTPRLPVRGSKGA